jgi:acetone carboxylase gamma subunit
MNFPLQENLEVDTNAGGSQIRCTKCFYVYCEFGEDWRKVAVVRHSLATSASPLMKDFADRLLLQQLFCPSCGALLDTRMVEKTEIG